MLWNKNGLRVQGGGPLEPSPPTQGESGILFPTLNGWLRRREENHVVSNGCTFYSCYLRQAC